MADEVRLPPLCPFRLNITDCPSQEGASPRELVLEASRRNNTDLLQEVLDRFTKQNKKTAPENIAKLLNTARDGIGNGVLHLAAANGNCMYIVHRGQERLGMDGNVNVNGLHR